MALFGSSTSPSIRMIALNDCVVPSPGDDGISSLTWSPTSNHLVSTNWDGGIRCWQVNENGSQLQAVPKSQVKYESPVLCSAFSSNGEIVFSGGCDKAVRIWTLSSNVSKQLGAHEKPVSAVKYLPSTNLLVSGGWDGKLNFWDGRQDKPFGILDVGERIDDMDVRGNLLCVATSAKQIVTYDMTSNPPRHVATVKSPLNLQTRCVSIFPDCTGFAVGNIEGRVGFHYLKKVPGKIGFSLTCYKKGDMRYSVNAISAHPQYGTFAMAGSDGVVKFFDRDNRKVLKKFPPVQQSIPCANFNATGNLFAYSSSYDWSKGSEFHSRERKNEIFIHHTTDDEIKPRKK